MNNNNNPNRQFPGQNGMYPNQQQNAYPQQQPQYGNPMGMSFGQHPQSGNPYGNFNQPTNTSIPMFNPQTGPSLPSFQNQGYGNQQYPQQNFGMGMNQPGQYGNPYQNQGMGMGMNPGQSYGGQGMGMGNQGMPSNMLLQNMIRSYSDQIFMKHDSNRSGKLDVKEIYPAISELFAMCGLPQPQYQAVLTIMKSFDNNGDGLIDMNEFRIIMMKMNGIY